MVQVIDRGPNRVVVGYIRVSTEEQAGEELSLSAQAARIKRYKELCKLHSDITGPCKPKVISDKTTGKDLDRPGIKSLIELIRQYKVAHVVVTGLDRLSENILDFRGLADLFLRYGVKFHSIRECIDTSLPSGQFFHMTLKALTELEGNRITERINKFLRSRGKVKIGCKEYTSEQIERRNDRVIQEPDAQGYFDAA